MAKIKDTTPITPVLPPSTKNHIGRGMRRQPPPEHEKEKKQHRPQKPDDGHQVDEYA